MKNQYCTWKASEESYLIKYYEFETLETLALQLGKTKEQVKQKAYKLRKQDVLKHIHVKKWTEDEIKILLDNYPKYSIEQLAFILKRKPKAVIDKIYFLRKKYNLKYRHQQTWTKEEDDKLIALYSKNTTTKEIAKRLNRTQESVKWRACKLRKQTNILSRRGLAIGKNREFVKDLYC